MKKTLYNGMAFSAVFVVSLLVSTPCFAQSSDGVTTSDVTITRIESEVLLEMTLGVSADAVTSLQSISVVPTLTDGSGHSATFPHVLVNGKNRAHIYRRHEKFRYAEIVQNPPFRVMNIDKKHPGGKVEYSARIPHEAWMDGARLSLVFVLASPAGEKQSYSVPVSEVADSELITISSQPEPGTRPAPVSSQPTPHPVTPPATVVEQSAPQLTPQPVAQPQATTQPVTAPQPATVTPAPQPPATTGKIHTLSGTANLDFETASSVLMPSFGRNRRELDALEAAIAKIATDPRARITSLVITGYSSPEGRYDTNASLAYDRAIALSRWLQARYTIPVAAVKIRAVGEDWSGLRAIIADSNEPYRDDVLKIIDSADAPDAKESRLRRMAGGQIWQRMERDIFPRLRKVDYSMDYEIAE